MNYDLSIITFFKKIHTLLPRIFIAANEQNTYFLTRRNFFKRKTKVTYNHVKKGWWVGYWIQMGKLSLQFGVTKQNIRCSAHIRQRQAAYTQQVKLLSRIHFYVHKRKDTAVHVWNWLSSFWLFFKSLQENV